MPSSEIERRASGRPKFRSIGQGSLVAPDGSTRSPVLALAQLAAKQIGTKMLLGVLEQTETDSVCELRHLQDEDVILKDTKWPTNTNKVRAVLLHSVSLPTVNAADCVACGRDRDKQRPGVFKECRQTGEDGAAACTNCFYSGHRTSCSLHAEKRNAGEIPDRRRSKKPKAVTETVIDPLDGHYEALLEYAGLSVEDLRLKIETLSREATEAQGAAMRKLAALQGALQVLRTKEKAIADASADVDS